jgi:glycosyltransferase involved in cell wall biosynthesis
LGIPEDAPVAGVFARLIPEKGQDRVLAAMISLKEQASDLHLIFCGGPRDSPYANALGEAAQRSGCQDRLHLVGPTDDPVPYYLACDFIINSRVGPEPFGLSVIEAMMLGLPVLAHALGGPADTVVDGVTGWHMRNMSDGEVRGGLERALAVRNEWPMLGNNARQRALDLFTLEAVARRLLDVFSSARPCADRSLLAAARYAMLPSAPQSKAEAAIR